MHGRDYPPLQPHPKSVSIYVTFGDSLQAVSKIPGRKGGGVQEREGWRETGLAGPPVPGPHDHNQTDQVACIAPRLILLGGIKSQVDCTVLIG
jgi:hypothetical protein